MVQTQHRQKKMLGSTMVMRQPRWRATECVTNGHPDKVCDQISDAILDAALKQDSASRVAIETHGGHGIITVNGEMTTKAVLDLTEIAKQTYRSIGHDNPIGATANVVKQSPNINALVSAGEAKEQGAGDQGIMVGYATAETPELMPLDYSLAHKLSARLTDVRIRNIIPGLRPDGKSQVVLEGNEVRHVTIAAHHEKSWDQNALRAAIFAHVIKYVLPEADLDLERNVVINGGGAFWLGGFDADAGTTGRKIVVDQFGPSVPVGGGAFSGKDPSKVDRSAAYMCRFVANAIVGNKLAPRATVSAAYAIGRPTAFMVSVQTPDLSQENEVAIEQLIREKFDFRPAAIIERLGLLKPNGWSYRETAATGHYGNKKFPWESVVDLS